LKYRGFVEDALGREYENPLAGTVAGAILGSDDFVEMIVTAYLG
jgi:hypothetical protein